MSGIDGYQSQLNQLNTDLTSIEAELKKLELNNQNVVNAYNSAKSDVQRTLEQVRGFGLTDLQGKPLQFNTLQEFHDLCLKGGIMEKGKPINNGNPFWYTAPPIVAQLEALKTAEANYNRVLGPTLDKFQEAQRQFDSMGTALKESISSLKAMNKVLDSGDIEGAVMLLQTSRAKNLEGQLATQIKTMQDRNARITILNNQLKDKQVALGNVGTDNTEANNKARAKIQGEITDLKSQIDTLNSDSQIDMIRTQSLVNKRNEAFDTLTNLLGKFQRTIDGIVGNYR